MKVNRMATVRSARSSTLPSSQGTEILSELFSSRVRAAILGFMVAREEARFSLTELSRITGLSISSIQHECYKLERLGILGGRREGVSRRYWLERDTPFVPVLMWLVVTVVGQEQLLRYALMDLPGVQGAILRTDGTPELILVGDIAFEVLGTAQERVAKLLELQPPDVNVAMYSTVAWDEHIASDDGRNELQRGSNTVLIGERPALLP